MQTQGNTHGNHSNAKANTSADARNDCAYAGFILE